MTIGELISAAVVDERVWDAYQETAPDGIYLVGQPGPALAFVIFSAWKVPTGFVSEEIRLVGPSGRTLYRWGPQVRRMKGAMDLTVELDRIDDAVLEETGTYVASFILEGEIIGEIEFPVYVQAAALKLPKETEEGLRKSDVIWVGTRVNGDKRMAPVWFAFKDGKIYLLSCRDPDAHEQTVPGRPGRAGARGGDPAKAPRYVTAGVHGGAASAGGTGVGDGREDARGPAPKSRRAARRVARSVAREVRHSGAHAERGDVRLNGALGCHAGGEWSTCRRPFGTPGASTREEDGVLGSSFAVIGRIIVLVIWLGTGAFDTAFTTWIFPLLGLIFLPFATMAFTIAKSADAGLVVVVMASGPGGHARRGERGPCGKSEAILRSASRRRGDPRAGDPRLVTGADAP